MKKLISSLAVLLIISLLFFLIPSCAPDMPYANKHWLKYSQDGGPWIYNPHYPMLGATKASGVIIDCENGQDGCQGEADFWGGAYDNVNVIRVTLDSFYSKYYSNDLSSWLTRDELDYLFPDLEHLRPNAIDSLLHGDYRFWVMGDSSIIIVKAPLDSISSANAVWVLDRDAEPRN